VPIKITSGSSRKTSSLNNFANCSYGGIVPYKFQVTARTFSVDGILNYYVSSRCERLSSEWDFLIMVYIGIFRGELL
jgi:hypothetical protein